MSPVTDSRPSRPSGARTPITGSWARVAIPAQPVVVIEVAPLGEVVAGDTRQLRAVARMADGRGMADQPISWWSSNPSVATVTESGLLLAHKAGVTRITAQSDGAQAQFALSVNSEPSRRAS
jgi:uncharacterized protein YjdB